MDGSSSISGLARMTESERLLRIERVGDKKNNESNDKSQSDKHKKDDERPKQEFAAVIVDVGNSTTVKPKIEKSSPEEPSTGVMANQSKETANSGEIENSKVSQDNDSNDKNIESQGHIDVTG